MAMHLDIHTVEAFLKVAELNSFTLAAESLCVTQSGVTVKIQRLEKAIGYSLFYRTPRHIYLSPEGEAFLPKARSLMKAHEYALAPVNTTNGTRDFSIGISDHVFYMRIMQTLNHLQSKHPDIRIKVEIDNSTKILKRVENKSINLGIITQDGDKKGGEKVRTDTYKWYGSNIYTITNNGLSLITLRDSCRLRKVAMDLLTEQNIEWYDGFQGGGLSTIIAAAKAGLGVVPLPENALTMLDKIELHDVGKALNLPDLPPANVVIHSNCIDPHLRFFIRELTEHIIKNTPDNYNSSTCNGYKIDVYQEPG